MTYFTRKEIKPRQPLFIRSKKSRQSLQISREFGGDIRDALRHSGNELELLDTRLGRNSQDRGVAVTLINFSGRGFGIRIPQGALPDQVLSPGHEVNFRWQKSPAQAIDFTCEIAHIGSDQGQGLRIGLKRVFAKRELEGRLEQRKSLRHRLPAGSVLCALIAHPLMFGHSTQLNLIDVNERMGLSFETDDPLFVASPGMMIFIRFDLPTFVRSPMLAKVAWVSPIDRIRTRIGIEALDMPYDLYRAICHFLLHSQVFSPGLLREAGFYIRQIKEDIRFRNATSLEDYARVLRLRLEAYLKVGKVGPLTPPEAMAMFNDSHSRIIMAMHGDVLVGSLTLSFPQSDEEILESEKNFPSQRYPISIPSKLKLVEVSRLCISSDYRGTDILQGLFEHGYKSFLLSDRELLITSAVDELLPLYERIGMRKMGASYFHARLNHLEHHLLSISKEACLKGTLMHPLAWNITMGQMIKYLLDHGLVKIRLSIRLRIRVLLLLRPVAHRLLGNELRRSFQNHLVVLRGLEKQMS